MQLRNRFINKAMLGLLLGIMVGVFFWVLSAPDERSSDRMALVIHLAVSGLLGLIAMGGSVVYEIESWGVLRATVIHYSVVMIDFTLASLFLNWFPDWSSFFVMVLIMTVAYAAIWVGESLYWKKTIRNINERLEEVRSSMNAVERQPRS